MPGPSWIRSWTCWLSVWAACALAWGSCLPGCSDENSAPDENAERQRSDRIEEGEQASLVVSVPYVVVQEGALYPWLVYVEEFEIGRKRYRLDVLDTGEVAAGSGPAFDSLELLAARIRKDNVGNCGVMTDDPMRSPVDFRQAILERLGHTRVRALNDEEMAELQALLAEAPDEDAATTRGKRVGVNEFEPLVDTVPLIVVQEGPRPWLVYVENSESGCMGYRMESTGFSEFVAGQFGPYDSLQMLAAQIRKPSINQSGVVTHDPTVDPGYRAGILEALGHTRVRALNEEEVAELQALLAEPPDKDDAP